MVKVVYTYLLFIRSREINYLYSIKQYRAMLSQSQVTSPTDVSALADSTHNSLCHSNSGPAIAVTRPSLVSASVDDSELGLLRAKFYADSRNRSSSLSVDGLLRANSLKSRPSRSAQSSPKLQRRPSFKVKKLRIFKCPSNGLDGYEPLNTDFTEEASQFSRERVTSLNLAVSRNSSFNGSSTPSSPCRYRTMTFSPAKNRVIQFDSSSEDEEEENGAISPSDESDLDFGSGTRNKPSHVSKVLKTSATNSCQQATC